MMIHTLLCRYPSGNAVEISQCVCALALGRILCFLWSDHNKFYITYIMFVESMVQPWLQCNMFIIWTRKSLSWLMKIYNRIRTWNECELVLSSSIRYGWYWIFVFWLCREHNARVVQVVLRGNNIFLCISCVCCLVLSSVMKWWSLGMICWQSGALMFFFHNVDMCWMQSLGWHHNNPRKKNPTTHRPHGIDIRIFLLI